MLSRIITSLYNEAFAPVGVTYAQASLLMSIFAQPGVRQVMLSRRLQIEKSALSRDVQGLLRHGWIGENVRNGLYLTEEGNRVAKRCHTIWKEVHEQVRDKLGEDSLQALAQFSDQLFSVKAGRNHESFP